MPQKSVEFLNIVPDGTYVDATFGGGGHARLIAEKIQNGRLIAFDQDPDAAKNVFDNPCLTFVPNNFRFLTNFLHFHNAVPVDGIFADLGVSSFQLDQPSKGFSYMHPQEKLDMRMHGGKGLTAADILNSYSDKQLSELFFSFAEVSFARKLTKDIIQKRETARFTIIGDLLPVIDRFVHPMKTYSTYSKIFQALRMEVNGETTALGEFLKQSLDVLKPGGSMVVISYHSIEDRMVKNFFRSGNIEGVIEKDFYGKRTDYFQIVTKKPVTPDEDELKENNRARSAKLRAAIKL